MLKKDYKNSYVCEILGYTSVYEDDYNDGECDYVNAWDTDSKQIVIKALNENGILQLQKFILNYLNDMLFDRLNLNNFSENVIAFDTRIDYSQPCNENNQKPTETEIELWKKGKCKLYTQDISLYMTINGIAVSEEDLNTIIEYKEAK